MVSIVDDTYEVSKSIKAMHKADAEVLTGEFLDKLAAKYKLQREPGLTNPETDYSLRQRVIKVLTA